MSESSGTSFSGFGLEELCNLTTTEMVTVSVETPQSTATRAHTDYEEVSVKQNSPAQPDQGDHTRRATQGLGSPQSPLGD